MITPNSTNKKYLAVNSSNAFTLKGEAVRQVLRRPHLSEIGAIFLRSLLIYLKPYVSWKKPESLHVRLVLPSYFFSKVTSKADLTFSGGPQPTYVLHCTGTSYFILFMRS